jgi:hypothetical protein
VNNPITRRFGSRKKLTINFLSPAEHACTFLLSFFLSFSLYLPLCEVQGDGDLVPPQSGEVVAVDELVLQLTDLSLGEGRALLSVAV